jgi:hypothetical protein
MGALMTGMAGPDGRRRWAAPHGAMVLHVWADVQAVGDVAGQVTQLERVRDAGWWTVLAVPQSFDWNGLAAGAAGAGLPVVRWSLSGRRPPGRWWAAPGSPAARAQSQVMTDVALVHAHDDRAVDQWRSVARRCAVPLIWDVDLQEPATAADGRRLLASSYLVTRRRGARLARRTLPPYQPAAGPGAGRWFDLAEDDDIAARLPAVAARTVCEVYACLTGQSPAPSIQRTGEASAAALTR